MIKDNDLTAIRIKEFRVYKRLSQVEFAGVLGINDVQFNKYERSKTAIPLRLISKIISAYPEVNPNWILTGKGKMILPVAANLDQVKGRIEEPSVQYIPNQADFIRLQKEGLKDKEKIINLLEMINTLETERAENSDFDRDKP